MQEFAGLVKPDPAIGLVAILALMGALTLLWLRWKERIANWRTSVMRMIEVRHRKTKARSSDRRVAPRHHSGSVLRGQIDHLKQICAIWGPETRDEAVKQVAKTMRAGLRKNDLIIEAEGAEGNATFIIIAKGASEEEASQIANRLLKMVADVEVSGMSTDIDLTASFGIAARRRGESVNEWHARAGSALAAAQATGEDRVVTASEWEEFALQNPDGILTQDAEDVIAA